MDTTKNPACRRALPSPGLRALACGFALLTAPAICADSPAPAAGEPAARTPKSASQLGFSPDLPFELTRQRVHLRLGQEDHYEGRVRLDLRLDQVVEHLHLDSEGHRIDELSLHALEPVAAEGAVRADAETSVEPGREAPPAEQNFAEKFTAIEVPIHWWPAGRDPLDDQPTDEVDRDEETTRGIRIEAASPLEPGRYRIEVAFRGRLREARTKGLFRVREGEHSYVFSLFQPDLARTAFPCIDRPDVKTRFEVVLKVPAAHRAFSNAPRANESLDDGWRTVRFEPTAPISTYLLAVATGPLDSVDLAVESQAVESQAVDRQAVDRQAVDHQAVDHQSGRTIPGRILLPAGRGAERTADLQRFVRQLLPALETYFGTPYPFAKLDWVLVPRLWLGGMETPGLVVLSEDRAALDPERASVESRRRLAQLVAHELAHMWFGNLVTPRHWRDLWLNESFARWMERRVVQQVAPELGTGSSALEADHRTKVDDGSPRVEPLRPPPGALAGEVRNLRPTFALSVAKGAALLGMVEGWLGEDLFRQAVRDHLDRFAWGNADSDDLLASLDHAARSSLGHPQPGSPSSVEPSRVLGPFLERPGLPHIRLGLATGEAGPTLLLRQNRYRPLSLPHPDQPTAPWTVPLRLRLGRGQTVETHELILDRPSLSLPLGPPGTAAPEWIYPDADAAGYYRFALDPPWLERLLEHAVPQALSTREAISLVGHLEAMLAAGDLDGGGLLRALARLLERSEPAVLGAVLGALEQVEPAFRAADPDGFARYVLSSLGPVAAGIGLAPDPRAGDEPAAVRALRPRLLLLLGLHGREPAVLEWAEATVEALLDGEEVDLDLREVALRLAMLRADASLYERLQSHYEASGSALERRQLARALGGADDRRLRDQALAYALDGPHGPNETVAIAVAMAHDPDGQRRLLEWAFDHYEELYERVPPAARPLIPTVVRGCSTAPLARARSFFAEQEERAPGTLHQLGQIADRVERCAALAEREGDSVRAYFAASAAD